ncbi:hypothetical protein CDV36_000925 [Fusarium kuroshium]|uniref:Transcription factor domain-containing protein n=1 Tax=Fusarium kuroshium TaxID=2010991 RepID=A0A3M2SPG8_9HYPO|nr:hypothetical protein CDV36_000925 [Fusarium kuroshium]
MFTNVLDSRKESLGYALNKFHRFEYHPYCSHGRRTVPLSIGESLVQQNLVHLRRLNCCDAWAYQASLPVMSSFTDSLRWLTTLCQRESGSHNEFRRGGARVRKKNRAWEQAVADKQTTEQIPQHGDVWDPAQDADVIFDALFSQSIISGGDILSESPPDISSQFIPSVRTYQDDTAILDAYYIFIHPYFPILPPPKTIPRDQAIPRYQNNMDGSGGESEPSTSISLAISAMLALIPCLHDPHPTSKESVLFRRDYAQYLAQCALECIEIESEIPESSVDPAKALLQTPCCDSREPFHPEVPLELESIIALDILSAYEYAQRGNLKKMENRAGQALMAAMSLSLHLRDDNDEPNEAKRRVWWMTACLVITLEYICVSQAAIVGNIEPSILAVFIPTFATEYPALESDLEVFRFLRD